MYLIAVCVAGLCILIVLLARTKRLRDQRELEEHCIEPDALHALLEGREEVLLLDVRQPLDLLAHSEIIPGAKRIPPKDIIEQPSLIPKQIDAIVYCTCPSEKTSRMILRQALALHFLRIKFLKGGLEGWKAKGFPVEPYKESFHLDTAS